MKKIILASTSPYRRMLFDRLGLPYDCVAPGVEELNPGLPLEDLAVYLAEKKAGAVFLKHSEAICIGADQVLIANGVFYEKPLTLENNYRQLMSLSGQEACFYTGLCVIAGGQQRCSTTLTRVRFRVLTEDSVERYLAKEPSFDCAGGFKSEGLGIVLLREIETQDPTALIGLPLIKLVEELSFFGVNLP